MVPQAACECCPKRYENTMYVRNIAIEGLSDLPRFKAESLGRAVVIRGPGPASSAVGDGLGLLFGALNESVLRGLLQRWGLIQTSEEAEIEATPLPIQASWSDRGVAQDLIADTTKRRIHVSAGIELDPPLGADFVDPEHRGRVGVDEEAGSRLCDERRRPARLGPVAGPHEAEAPSHVGERPRLHDPVLVEPAHRDVPLGPGHERPDGDVHQAERRAFGRGRPWPLVQRQTGAPTQEHAV